MFTKLTKSLFTLLLTATLSRADFSNADDPDGVQLFMASPACDFFRCSDPWAYGSTQLIDWFLPTPGNVSVQIAGIEKTNSNLTFSIVKSMPADTTPNCDSGKGYGVEVPGKKCGGLFVTVPSLWPEGNYTIVVTSLHNKTIQGFTDVVAISKKNQTLPIPSKPLVEIAPKSSITSISQSTSAPPIKAVSTTTTDSTKTTSLVSNPGSTKSGSNVSGSSPQADTESETSSASVGVSNMGWLMVVAISFGIGSIF